MKFYITQNTIELGQCDKKLQKTITILTDKGKLISYSDLEGTGKIKEQ